MIEDIPKRLEDIYYLKEFLDKKYWTITDINRRIFGTLKYDSENSYLEFQLPTNESSKVKNKRLNNVTSVGENTRASILRSSAWSSVFSDVLSGDGDTRFRLQPEILIFQGGKDKTITKITNLKGSLPGIASWFGDDFLDFDYKTYEFKQKKELYHEIPIGTWATVYLYARLKIDLDSIASEKFVAYTESYAKIVYTKQVPIENAIHLYSYIENFFNFIFSTPHSTHLFKSVKEHKTRERGINIFIAQPGRNKRFSRLESRFSNGAMFKWNDVSNFNEIFKNWIIRYEEIQEIVDVFVLLKSTKIGEETRFTALINSLEAVHRRFYDLKKESDEEYKKRVDEIIKSLDENNKSFVEGRLQYGNEVSLRDRLKHLYELGEAYDLDKPSSYIRGKIIPTRNYLTHGDINLKKSMLTGFSLETANAYLGRCLKLVVLIKLGIKEDELKKIVKESNQFATFYRDEPTRSAPYFF